MFNSLVESMNEVSRPEYCKVGVSSVEEVVSEVKEEGLPPAQSQTLSSFKNSTQ